MRPAGLLQAASSRPRHLLLAALAVGLGVVGACAPDQGAVAGGGDVHGLRAVVAEAPRISPDGSSLAASATISDGPARGARVLVRVRRPAQLPGIGREVELDGRLAPPGRDRLALARRCTMVLRASGARPTGRRRGGIPGFADGLRERAQGALDAALPADEAALAAGMVLGQDEALAPAARDDFRRSGLAHLVAASGTNVALLAALALPLFAWAGLSHRARLAAVLALVALYVPIAGGGPPIQRAAISAAAAIAAGLAGRPVSRSYVFLLAAVATLALDPRAVADVSWQLSFAAVLALLVLGPALTRGLAGRGVPSAVAEPLALTLAATLGTAPVSVARFGTVSLAGLLANVLVAPAVGAVMGLGFVTAALGQAGPALAAAPAAAALPLLAWIEAVAHVTARLPGAVVGPAGALVAALAACTCALALRALPRPWRARSAAAVVVLAAGACVVLAPWRAPGPPQGLRVEFLDVGQGDATLIQDGARSVLVDTGPPGSALLSRLRAAGAGRIDLLVVTHGQADHEGGAADVLASHAVGTLLDGAARMPGPAHAAILARARARGVPVLEPDAGQRLRVGRIVVDVLWPARLPPGAQPTGDPNDRAIVARVHAPGLRLLLTADAESNVLSQLDLPPSDVLKVPHHGSADPGLAGVLAAVRPRLAVIEVGARNTYGHPAPATLATLRAASAAVLRTDRDGTVAVRPRGRRLDIQRGA